MLKNYGWVAHMILVSAQVLLVLTLGLRTLDFGLGLDNKPRESFICYILKGTKENPEALN